MRRWQTLGGVLVAVAFGLWAVHVMVGFPDTRPLSDALKDWLSVAAVVGEGSPTDDLGDLALIHVGVSTGVAEAHPRPPGALLLQMPYALGGWQAGGTVIVLTVVVAVVFVAWAVVRVAGLRWWWFPVLACYLFISDPIRAAFGIGGQGPLVAALIAGTWLLARRGDSWGAGVPLGVAATLKMYPGLLIPVLWMQGRRKAAASAAALVAALNLGGLLLPDVSLAGQIGTLFGQKGHLNPVNLSPELPLAVAAAGAVLVVAAAWRMRFDGALALGSVAMFVLSPVVWIHYLLALAVPVAVAAGWLRRRVAAVEAKFRPGLDVAVGGEQVEGVDGGGVQPGARTLGH